MQYTHSTKYGYTVNIGKNSETKGYFKSPWTAMQILYQDPLPPIMCHL